MLQTRAENSFGLAMHCKTLLNYYLVAWLKITFGKFQVLLQAKTKR